MPAVWPQKSKSTHPSEPLRNSGCASLIAKFDAFWSGTWFCKLTRIIWLSVFSSFFFLGAGFLWTRKWFADRAPPYCAHFDDWCPGQSHPLFRKLFRQRIQPQAPWKALTWKKKKKKHDCLRVVAWNITPASPVLTVNGLGWFEIWCSTKFKCPALQFIFSGSSYSKWPHPIPSSLTSAVAACWTPTGPLVSHSTRAVDENVLSSQVRRRTLPIFMRRSRFVLLNWVKLSVTQCSPSGGDPGVFNTRWQLL